MMTVTPYPKPPYLPKSDVFALTVDGKPVDVAAYKGFNVARLAFDGTARFEVTCHIDDVRWAVVSPERLGVRHERRADEDARRGRVLTFDHSQRPDGPPPHLVVRIGRDRHEHRNVYSNIDDPPQTHLVILADAPADYPDEGDVLDVVRDGDADPTGQADSGPAFERLAADLTARGGGTLHVPDGLYRLPGLALTDGVTLRLSPGAFLRAYAEPQAYTGPWSPDRTPGKHRALPPFVRIDNATDVAIVGHGVIDANNEVMGLGGDWGRSPYRRHGIRAENVTRLLLDGPVVVDTMQWATRFNRSRDITVRNYKVLNNPLRRTNDGINFDGSHTGRVDRCFVYVGDDGLNVKASFDDHPAFDILFRDCTVCNGEIAMQLGAENFADIHGVRYERIDIVRGKMVVGIINLTSKQTQIGGVRDIVYHDVYAEELFLPSTHPNNLDAQNVRSARPFSVWTSLAGSPIDNVRLSDVTIQKADLPLRPAVHGLDASTGVSGVGFHNVRVNGTLWRSAGDGDVSVNAFAHDVTFTADDPAERR